MVCLDRPQRVLVVRNLTVAKVDSIGLVVLRWGQRSAENQITQLIFCNLVGARLRWPRLVTQLGGLFKVYSDCHSYRQDLFLNRSSCHCRCACGGVGQARRLVHPIHRRVASVGLGWGFPIEGEVGPFGVVEADPLVDEAPGLEAVGKVALRRLLWPSEPWGSRRSVIDSPCGPID